MATEGCERERPLSFACVVTVLLATFCTQIQPFRAVFLWVAQKGRDSLSVDVAR